MEQSAVGQGALDHLQQLLGLERLFQVVVGARLHRLDDPLARAVGGQHDHRQVGPVPLDPLQDLDAVESGHPDIQEHDIDPFAPQDLQCLLPVGCLQDLQIRSAEQVTDVLPHGGFVVDNQKRLRIHDSDFLAESSGRVTRQCAPLNLVGSANSMVPRCAFTIS